MIFLLLLLILFEVIKDILFIYFTLYEFIKDKSI